MSSQELFEAFGFGPENTRHNTTLVDVQDVRHLETSSADEVDQPTERLGSYLYPDLAAAAYAQRPDSFGNISLTLGDRDTLLKHVQERRSGQALQWYGELDIAIATILCSNLVMCTAHGALELLTLDRFKVGDSCSFLPAVMQELVMLSTQMPPHDSFASSVLEVCMAQTSSPQDIQSKLESVLQRHYNTISELYDQSSPPINTHVQCNTTDSHGTQCSELAMSGSAQAQCLGSALGCSALNLFSSEQHNTPPDCVTYVRGSTSTSINSHVQCNTTDSHRAQCSESASECKPLNLLSVKEQSTPLACAAYAHSSSSSSHSECNLTDSPGAQCSESAAPHPSSQLDGAASPCMTTFRIEGAQPSMDSPRMGMPQDSFTPHGGKRQDIWDDSTPYGVGSAPTAPLRRIRLPAPSPSWRGLYQGRHTDRGPRYATSSGDFSSPPAAEKSPPPPPPVSPPVYDFMAKVEEQRTLLIAEAVPDWYSQEPFSGVVSCSYFRPAVEVLESVLITERGPGSQQPPHGAQKMRLCMASLRTQRNRLLEMILADIYWWRLMGQPDSAASHNALDTFQEVCLLVDALRLRSKEVDRAKQTSDGHAGIRHLLQLADGELLPMDNSMINAAFYQLTWTQGSFYDYYRSLMDAEGDRTAREIYTWAMASLRAAHEKCTAESNTQVLNLLINRYANTDHSATSVEAFLSLLRRDEFAKVPLKGNQVDSEEVGSDLSSDDSKDSDRGGSDLSSDQDEVDECAERDRSLFQSRELTFT